VVPLAGQALEVSLITLFAIGSSSDFDILAGFSNRRANFSRANGSGIPLRIC